MSSERETAPVAAAPLSERSFDDSFVRELPGDHSFAPGSRQVPNCCYSLVTTTPVRNPRLLGWSASLADKLGIFAPADSEGDPTVEILAGNSLAPGMRPYAARYGGHQFGTWAGQLGDGRAITLGELVTAEQSRWELQLKGAGPTPYSRRADGRAVLRSSLREFLCSEAMHYLGIPTTRALSLVGTGEEVVRDMFYDGNPRPEPGAVVCRVAPTFLRFGNFQIHAAYSETETLKRLAAYLLTTHYPQLLDQAPDSAEEIDPSTYAALFGEVARRTARMIAKWMGYGFVHGVMNTDNMSVLGLTIDYGPYGWLEGYDLDWTPNTTDAASRRYAYGQQPEVALWNLARFAESLLALGTDQASLETGLDDYRVTFQQEYSSLLAQKLGFRALESVDNVLVADLYALLQATETDMTLFFRTLSLVAAEGSRAADEQVLQRFEPAYYQLDALQGEVGQRLLQWLERYRERLAGDELAPSLRLEMMRKANPKYVLRNYLAQQAIDKAELGDTTEIARLLKVLQRPFDEQPEAEDLAARRPEWARDKAGCSALSCSS